MRVWKIMLICLLVVFVSVLAAADSDIPDDTDGPDTGGKTDGQTSFQQQVVDEMNQARTRPAEYARKVARYIGYFDGDLLRVPGEIAIRTREGVSAYHEAVNYLKRVSPVEALTMSVAISRACQDHCTDQGPRGRTGHTGSDGSSPFQRMARYGRWLRTAGENISYGPSTAERIVIQLIVDDGVPSRGHRTNIFNPAFRVAGVGIGSHSVYRYMCVIGYAGGFEPN